MDDQVLEELEDYLKNNFSEARIKLPPVSDREKIKELIIQLLNELKIRRRYVDLTP